MTDVNGAARTLIGVAKGVTMKAVSDPAITAPEARTAIEAARIMIQAYEGLILLGKPGSQPEYIARQKDTPERDDYAQARRFLALLEAFHTGRPA